MPSTCLRAEQIHAVKVVILSASGRYGEGASIEVAVTFSDQVQVQGVPYLVLRLVEEGGGGTRRRNAPYIRGAGTRTLVFSYRVGRGDVAVGLRLAVGPTKGTSQQGGDERDERPEERKVALLGLETGKSSVTCAVDKQDNVSPVLPTTVGQGNMMGETKGIVIDAPLPPPKEENKTRAEKAVQLIVNVSVSAGVVIRVSGAAISTVCGVGGGAASPAGRAALTRWAVFRSFNC